VQDLTEVQSLIHQIKGSITGKTPPALLADRCDRARRILIRIRAQFDDTQKDTQQILQDTIVTLKRLEEGTMKAGISEGQPFDSKNFYGPLNDQMDKVTELLAHYKKGEPQNGRC
jgi:hypothetical protein